MQTTLTEEEAYYILNMSLSLLSDNGTFILKMHYFLIEANFLEISEILLLQSCQYCLHVIKCKSVKWFLWRIYSDIFFL